MEKDEYGWYEELMAMVEQQAHPPKPLCVDIQRVIHHAPATIILWDDGDKTIVKCSAGDTYDPEKGFMLAYLKHIYGHTGLRKLLEKWCPDEAVMA